MQTWKDGVLVDCNETEFLRALYQQANWAEEEFSTRSDPAAHLGLIMTQAAAAIAELIIQRDDYKRKWEEIANVGLAAKARGDAKIEMLLSALTEVRTMLYKEPLSVLRAMQSNPVLVIDTALNA